MMVLTPSSSLRLEHCGLHRPQARGIPRRASLAAVIHSTTLSWAPYVRYVRWMGGDEPRRTAITRLSRAAGRPSSLLHNAMPPSLWPEASRCTAQHSNNKEWKRPSAGSRRRFLPFLLFRLVPMIASGPCRVVAQSTRVASRVRKECRVLVR